MPEQQKLNCKNLFERPEPFNMSSEAFTARKALTPFTHPAKLTLQSELGLPAILAHTAAHFWKPSRTQAW